MFDDVVDFFQLVTDKETYTNPPATLVKVERFIENSGRQKLIEGAGEGAKRFAFVPLGAKVIDNFIDKSGVDPDRAVRDRIGFDKAGVQSGGQSDLLDDEVILVASDDGPFAPPADKKVSGWFDP